MALTKTTWPIVQVNSFAELLEAVESCSRKAESEGHRLAWRGLAKTVWSLRSTLDRLLLRVALEEVYMTWIGRERDLLEEFRCRAKRYASNMERTFLKSNDGEGVWNVMALGRHHGLPTRILDWTWSPWVAAYFACMEHADADGVLWWFDQTRLETVLGENWKTWQVRTRDEVFGYGGNERALEDTAFSDDGRPWLTKIHYSIMFPRMEVQQGFMTACGRLGVDHNDAIDQLPSACSIPRGCIRITVAQKSNILERLESFNTTASSLLYPGIDIVAREIGRRAGGRAE